MRRFRKVMDLGVATKVRSLPSGIWKPKIEGSHTHRRKVNIGDQKSKMVIIEERTCYENVPEPVRLRLAPEQVIKVM